MLAFTHRQKHPPGPMLLAINPKGVYLLDSAALARMQIKEPSAEHWFEDVVVDHYPISEIANWGCSAAVFVQDQLLIISSHSDN